MLTFWIIATIFLIGQETISTGVVFTYALIKGYSSILLMAVFLIVTIAQILIFHWLGSNAKSKNTRNIISSLSRIYILKSERFINRWGNRIFLIFLASSLFPPLLSAYMAAWLEFPFWKKLSCIILGDCLWYITTWFIVFGIDLITVNPEQLIPRVAVVSLLFVIFQRRLANQLLEQ
jgi:hypothetical protein